MPPTPIAKASERVPLTYSPIRVISDIDDTVKLSGVHCGARAVFHNVFVKDLEENLIPGMGEWYSEMWRRGVRFHYVVSPQMFSTSVYPKRSKHL
jgi:phosphatidate phosphatase APP1